MGTTLRWYQGRQMYPNLPMAAKSRLPDEGMSPTLMPVADMWFTTGQPDATLTLLVTVAPKPKPGQRWGHRVFVRCPCCNGDVPFGRMIQHFPACAERPSWTRVPA